MGNGKRKAQGGSKKATSTALPAVQGISDDAKRIARELMNEDSLSAEDQYSKAGAFAKALGLSFKGHKPHGANFSKRQPGTKVMQNVLDGMTQCAHKTHLQNEIFQETGWRPE